VDSYRNNVRQARIPAILHIGTSTWKNPAATLEAFALMDQPAELYIAGNSTPELERRLASLPNKKRDRIFLMGIVDSIRLKELLSTVRVLSVPSLYAAPVASPTVLDGLASGTPVVGSTSISTDLLTDEHTGFRSNPGDARELATKFELLLRNDALWETISNNCRTRSEAFSNEAIMRKFRDLATSRSQIATADMHSP
jgi:glycosyltransferase involved in cell wall biosynthesis